MRSELRALVVDLSVRFGGTSARVLGLLKGMPVGAAALASLADSPVTEQAKAAGLEVYSVGRRKFDPRIVGRLSAIVRNHGFDVLDAQNPQSKLWASRAAARTGAALVSTLNSWYLSEHGGNLRGRLYQALERATSTALDMYIVVSEEIRQLLRATGVPEQQIALIHNAVHIDPQAVDGGGDWLREKFDLPPQACVVCSVGRLVAVKGFDYLVRSIAQLVTQHPEIHCLIVGSGELGEKLGDQIASLDLEGRVRLAGYCPHQEVLRIVKAADLFVMPSLSEGTPVALLEAAAFGKPIVATRVGGIPTILTHGVDALLVGPASATSLTKAISQMVQDGPRAAGLGREAMRRVRRDFSRAAQVEATRDAYRAAHQHALSRKCPGTVRQFTVRSAVLPKNDDPQDRVTS